MAKGKFIVISIGTMVAVGIIIVVEIVRFPISVNKKIQESVVSRSTALTITFMSPRKDEHVLIGDKYDITWTGTKDGGTLRLVGLDENGCDGAIANFVAGQIHFVWNTAQTLLGASTCPGNYVIKIIQQEGRGWFTAGESPPFYLVLPMGQ